jgi:hypothetical protein
MKKRFKLFTPLKIALVVAVFSGFFCCDDKSPAEEAREAAVFMCDCMDGSRSQSKLDGCIEKMQKKFNDWGTDEFLKTFNKENDCGITLYRTTSKANENSPLLNVVSAKQAGD